MFFHGCRIAILRICLLGGVAKYNLIPPYTGLKKSDSFGPLNVLSLLQQVIIRIIVV